MSPFFPLDLLEMMEPRADLDRSSKALDPRSLTDTPYTDPNGNVILFSSAGQPWYYGWGFNLPRGQALLDKWNQIPDSTDILLTHCPPLGFLDWVPRKMQRVGCMELLNTVQRRVQPKLHVFGHIHEGYGMMTDGTTTFVNASACTVNFQPMNAPIVFDLPNPRSS
ncbi:Metallophosphoesterase domain-containing protein 1 [Labeo rohita]|uniref:Metallophosphoesterase domain-containing protein 1 n=1 Tax=Labeo rohita TaxID=84645 RepID=A0ABQ8MRQ0_LABRO|nr:Metallophosphoesterase domain-containing protein 1 [Labeo rohita]